MITLEKTFSRERSLFYTYIWMESDRNALQNWLGYSLKNSLYLRDANGKLTVWYEPTEFNKWQDLLVAKVAEDPTLIDKLKAALTQHWEVALPYLDGEKLLATVEDFETYYANIMGWWSSMANVFYIPNLDVPESVKEEALAQREAVEKYSDRIDSLCVEYWVAKNPELADIAKVISPYEVIEHGKGGLSEERVAKIRQRLNGFGMFNGMLYLKGELERVMSEVGVGLEGAQTQEVTQLKGVTACQGAARGIVRLVLLKSQVGELLQGEILVTEMTNPDFVPAMKKAAAIVTDEGGVTCHAAIVSREMGTPCVIGTKIATKVLKDGDKVEVDATTGMVRILSRA